MSETLRPTWSELKSVLSRGIKLHYTACGLGTSPETYEYNVYGSEGDRIYYVHLSGGDVTDFATNYMGSSIAVSGLDGVATLTPPSINALGAQLVDVTASLHQKNSLTIVSHDYSEPCTWWQNSTKVTQEVLTDIGSGIFTSAHSLWVNVEHPKIFNDETLNPGWAEGGYQNQDYYYLSWWQPNASILRRDYYYPIVEVQPGGSGSWITVTPSDATYGHTFEYSAGKVHFNDISGWTGGTLVRATYFWVAETAQGSLFQIGPQAGEKWYLVYTKVQISVGSSWQDSVIFEGTRYGVPGLIGRYKAYGNMQDTATESWETDGGIATSPQAWPAGPDNGWNYGGLDGFRNHIRKLENNKWKYEKPFVLYGSYQDKISISLGSGKKMLDADEVDVTLQFDTYDE